MTAIDVKFLGQVQDAGWHITGADQECVLGSCRRAGCGLKTTFRPGNRIPKVATRESEMEEHIIRGFGDVAKLSRDRRHELAWSIAETEEVAGMTPDYLAKMEKDNPSKIPNVNTFVDLMNAEGYEVFVRKAKMPPIALRAIVETRHRVEARRQMHQDREKKRQVPSE